MITSEYRSYDELPLFLNAKGGAPGENQQSSFAGERRSSGMNEFSPFGAETSDIKLATTRHRCWACPHPADTS